MASLSGSLASDRAERSMLSNMTDNKPGQLPREMVFNDDSLVSVIAYAVLFVIAAIGNLTVFITLFRNRKRRSRVNLFIMHLSVADLIVTFVMLPLEIGWHVTVSWKAGDAGCRIFMFCRTFGFYLSSFILIAISLDRYFAITRPLSLNDAGKRGKMMLFMAWLFSTLASLPQSVIFHQEIHPEHAWFVQCVTFNFFPTVFHEMAYNVFNIFTLYFIPLVVIILCYALILVEMSRKTKPNVDDHQSHKKGKARRISESLRRSCVGRIQKAKMNTLKMTIVIVLVFIVCWTPYFVIMSWWWFDRDSAEHVDTKIQRGLFIFAVSNSCMNPIVYGMFSTVFRRQLYVSCCGLCPFLKLIFLKNPDPRRVASPMRRGDLPPRAQHDPPRQGGAIKRHEQIKLSAPNDALYTTITGRKAHTVM